MDLPGCADQNDGQDVERASSKRSSSRSNSCPTKPRRPSGERSVKDIESQRMPANATLAPASEDRLDEPVKSRLGSKTSTLTGQSLISKVSAASRISVFIPSKAVRVFKVSYTVRAGGACLAFCAGLVNATAFHALSTFVSHVTGSFSRSALGLVSGEDVNAGDSVLLVFSFLAGSTTCGFFISKNTIHFGLALYDFGLMSVSTLLVLTTLTADMTVARYFACAACGLQNGMATHWGGAVIRTTHVTGLFTDVGLLIGRVLSVLCRKRCGQRFDAIDTVEVADDLSKMSVLVTIAAAFFFGIFIGAHLWKAIGHFAFLVPATFTGVAGASYSFYRVFVMQQNFFSSAEMEVVDVDSVVFDAEVKAAPEMLDTSGFESEAFEPTPGTVSPASSTCPEPRKRSSSGDSFESPGSARLNNSFRNHVRASTGGSRGSFLEVPGRSFRGCSKEAVVSVDRSAILAGTASGSPDIGTVS
eukprot:TRINITY_DN55896_c0_g1_i1.p1 TRINITY_DN55896_c0_g1~~TRINITY_DN55896_c0_g1_i1.p1  ORF type:complete len:473 (+),score=85.14 TRINITY_DN55896_c0_g1_i1:73-1491(+)